MNKRGPWSQTDKDYIKDNAEEMSPAQIAAVLQRDVKSVRKYLVDNGLLADNRYIDTEYDIQSSPHWLNIKKQFNTDEQQMFVWHWNNTILQFKDDVLHTEQFQVIDMVKIDILMERILTKQRDMETAIAQLETDIAMERNKGDDSNMVDILNMERQVAAYYTSMDASNKEYREMLKEKTKILDKLKATREARVKQIESSKTTITGWIRELYQNEKLRDRLGKDMEKMRLAMEVEYTKLSEYHTYEDGAVDFPLLTPELVQQRLADEKVEIDAETKRRTGER